MLQHPCDTVNETSFELRDQHFVKFIGRWNFESNEEKHGLYYGNIHCFYSERKPNIL